MEGSRPLYLISPGYDGGSWLDYGRRLSSIVDAAGTGLFALQLRERIAGRELLSLTREVVPACERVGAKLILNRRSDVALAANAHGVHLGARTFPPAAVRSILSPSQCLGYSAHEIGEIEALGNEVDHFLYSPIFSPISKSPERAPVGVEALAVACRATTKPVFALGGVAVHNVRSVRDAGAAGFAVIGAVFGSRDPRRAIGELLGIWRSSREDRA